MACRGEKDPAQSLKGVLQAPLWLEPAEAGGRGWGAGSVQLQLFKVGSQTGLDDLCEQGGGALPTTLPVRCHPFSGMTLGWPGPGVPSSLSLQGGVPSSSGPAGKHFPLCLQPCLQGGWKPRGPPSHPQLFEASSLVILPQM